MKLEELKYDDIFDVLAIRSVLIKSTMRISLFNDFSKNIHRKLRTYRNNLVQNQKKVYQMFRIFKITSILG